MALGLIVCGVAMATPQLAREHTSVAQTSVPGLNLFGGNMDLRLVIPLAVVVLAGLVLLALWVRRRAARARVSTAPPPSLPPPGLRVELPPSEMERARLEEAQAARNEAQRLAHEREGLRAEAEGASAQQRVQLEAEARALKEREEEKKREEYRAKKAAEREARERHARESAEEARQAAEAEAARARAEEEEKERAAREEAARIQAQAGQTLAQGLAATRHQGFMGRLQRLFGGERRIDESALAELEEVLFTADIGVQTASRLVQLARDRAGKQALSSAELLQGIIRKEIERILSLPLPASLEGGGPPHVTMVVGVNGSGKTTTLGKLASQRTARGDKVVMAAGDTFRAAAAEQLDVWADRAHAALVKGADNADPGAVVFDAVKRAQAEGAALVLADTAGRLHTKVPLMEELKKVKRVMGKALAGSPHEVLLVLDATVGQNAIAQAKQFHEAVGVTGLVLTKLDGTAKGGVVIGICDELKIPVAWVGVGERIQDLRRFDPKEFVAALFDVH
jgi:fused signal recognition particle receptor